MARLWDPVALGQQVRVPERAHFIEPSLCARSWMEHLCHTNELTTGTTA